MVKYQCMARLTREQTANLRWTYWFDFDDNQKPQVRGAK